MREGGDLLNRCRMRKRAAFALLIAACAVALGAALPDTTFLIRRGNHEDSTPGDIAGFQLNARPDRSVRFQVLFPASAAYATASPSNQADWNKVMGITTLFIHWNSIRLGWRWLPAEQKMELGFYGYLRGRRIERPLAKVALDVWTDVEMRLHANGLLVRAGGAVYEERQSLGFPWFLPQPTWILKTAYFGGDETAPHDIEVRARSISYR